MQCLQSHYSEKQKLPRDVQHQFLARGQKDKRSHQESLLESFQKQGRLPAVIVKAKGIKAVME